MMLVQVAIGIVLLWSIRGLLRAAALSGGHHRSLLETWIPAVLALPVVGLIEHDRTLTTASLTAMSIGPLVGAGVVAGWALRPPPVDWQRAWHVDDRVPLVWPVVGVLLLAMASAAELPAYTLLAALGVGIVCVWANQPRDRSCQGGGGWMLLAAAAAVIAARHCHLPSC